MLSDGFPTLTRMSIVELERQTPPSEGREAKFWADVPFVKKAAEDDGGNPTGALELRGYASTWVKDRDEEWIDPDAFAKSLDFYLKKNPIILWQHDQHQPIGTAKAAFVDEFGLNFIADVPKPTDKEPDWKWHAYHSIERGIVKTFSIGGIFQRDFVMGREVVKEIELLEVSVVSIPSNPESIFEAAVKALKGGSSRPKLNPSHLKQMRQLIGIDEVTDPELLLMTAAEKVERYKYLADRYTKSGVRPPALDEWVKLKPRVMDAKGSAIVGPAGELTALIRKANAGMAIEAKAGRAVSQKNEAKLRGALDVLVDAEKKIDEAAALAKAIVGDAKTSVEFVLKQVDDEDEKGAEEAGTDGAGTDDQRAEEESA